MADWKAANIPDLTGKTVLVTGANNGLGKASVQLMAAKGAQVVMAVRSISKGEFYIWRRILPCFFSSLAENGRKLLTFF